MGSLHSLQRHKCPPKNTVVPCPCHQCVSKSSESNPSFMDPVETAAGLLEKMAATHKSGVPVPAAVDRMTDRWMHRKLQATQSDTTLIRTGGMPIKLQKVVNSRKTSSEVTRAYQKQRSARIESFRNEVSLQDPNIHLRHDLEQEEPQLDVDSSIAMSRQMHSTWENLDVLRRYMSKIKVHVASERQMRRRRAELLKDPLEAEMVPLVYSCDTADEYDGLVTRDTPYVYVKDLPTLIIEFLDRHAELGNLTTHDDMIPEKEIWLKIGGDKGGSSMKMFAQIVNVQKPNSSSNTIIFAAFNGGDSAVNLDITMERFIPQLQTLKNMTWRDHTFRLSFFGDCELICRMYGILSCNAVHACPVCEESKSGWQLPLNERTRARPRTLATLKENFKQYEEDGCRSARAKHVSKSVVRPPMFPIEPQEISMPTLHIGLGVFKKIYDKLEEDANAIDEQIYRHRISNPEDEVEDKSNFDQAIQRRINERGKLQNAIVKKQEEMEEIYENIPLAFVKGVDKEAIGKTVEAIGQIRKDINEMEKKLEKGEFQFRSGPMTAALDGVLNKHGIARQQYHGKAFTGNHVMKGCKSAVFSDLVATPLNFISKLGDEDNLPVTVEREAERIKVKYNELFTKYSAVHNKINHGRNMTPEEITETESAVEDFMECLRRRLPSVQISLKLHLLEDHVIPQIKRLKAGLGKMNEQGGEASHGKQKKNEASSANMKKQPQRHLMTVMTNALTAALPDVQSKMLHRQKRKANLEE